MIRDDDGFNGLPEDFGASDLCALWADEQSVSAIADTDRPHDEFDDETLALLAAWATTARSQELAPGSERLQSPRPKRPRAGWRSTVGGIAVTGTLMFFGGGVAAAVTGNPLAGLAGLQAVTGSIGQPAEQPNPLRLSVHAREVRSTVREAAVLAQEGDTNAAARLLAQAQASAVSLSTGEQQVLANQTTQTFDTIGQGPLVQAAAPTLSAPPGAPNPIVALADPTLPNEKSTPTVAPTPSEVAQGQQTQTPSPAAETGPAAPSTASTLVPTATASGEATLGPAVPTTPGPASSTASGTAQPSGGATTAPAASPSPSAPNGTASATGSPTASSTASPTAASTTTVTPTTRPSSSSTAPASSSATGTPSSSRSASGPSATASSTTSATKTTAAPKAPLGIQSMSDATPTAGANVAK